MIWSMMVEVQILIKLLGKFVLDELVDSYSLTDDPLQRLSREAGKYDSATASASALNFIQASVTQDMESEFRG